ncbi:hypothetical protein EW145_g4122 [Phellinidium pouzarii]|uniref:AB hydrolase-1 domain-containing protein n=1 Tax=Phellinidium pouzarii TaxID=167371 RepID=A0A4S4L4V0_9AGAM|nr:hypothetical protein EW145_g4122 [Phellinidium pouzarii]
MAPNAQFITSSDGSKIYADAVGNPEKPSIVFIHGLALSGAVFDNIFNNAKYSNDVYLVRYDMRGHGRSIKPESAEGYTSKLYADDFAAVVKAFNAKKPILVGCSESCAITVDGLKLTATIRYSLAGTVAADIATHLPEDTISGIVYLAALPYIGPVMQRVGKPTVLGFLPGLFCEDSVSMSVKTAVEFVDTLFIDPSAVPWETKCLWIGMAACQTPAHRKFVLTRSQDPAKLLELGAKGLPLLVVNGTSDRQVDGAAVVSEMKPDFKNLEVAMIEKDGSHAVFYDNPDATMDPITKFAIKVQAKALAFFRNFRNGVHVNVPSKLTTIQLRLCYVLAAFNFGKICYDLALDELGQLVLNLVRGLLPRHAAFVHQAEVPFVALASAFGLFYRFRAYGLHELPPDT